MNCIYIGAFIKQRRKELKLTQEQVCSGICDPVTLSRIENGKQTPSKSVISALLQRLGMPEARYYVLESKNELEIEALKKDIIACGVLAGMDGMLYNIMQSPGRHGILILRFKKSILYIWKMEK